MLSYDLIFSLISVFQSADNYDSKLQQLRGDVNGAQCVYISLQKQFGYFTQSVGCLNCISNTNTAEFMC